MLKNFIWKYTSLGKGFRKPLAKRSGPKILGSEDATMQFILFILNNIKKYKAENDNTC